MRHETSQLTSLESWQFRKAMHRLMLYTRLFPTDEYAYCITSNSDCVDLNTKLEKELLTQQEFLSDRFTNELEQLREVATFAIEIIRWVDNVDSCDMIGAFHISSHGVFISLNSIQHPTEILLTLHFLLDLP